MILKKIKNRAPGWRPLVLHWRRRRVLRPVSKLNRVTSSVSVSYFPQVHFHFTTYVTNQNYRRTEQRTFSVNTVQRERVLLERRLEKRIHTDRVRVTERPLAYRPQINNINAPRFFSKHASFYTSFKHSAPIPIKIQRSPASAPIKTPLLVHTRVEESSKVLKKHTHLREHRSQTLSFRSASHETLLKIDRTEELVWRRTQPRTSVVDDGTVVNVRETTSRQPAARTSAVATTQTQSAPPANTNSTPQQITKLDPQLVDRLAEDVIRRVEKRALIERQRRGL